MNYTEINKRYSELAETGCCLSCGGALNYSNAAEGDVCADFGSGRGTDALRLAEIVGKDGYVYGLDISEGMIRKAVSTAEKLGVANVEFIHCPLEKTGLPDNKADLVISNCTINHSDDKEAVWKEIYRVLKKGGQFVVSDIYSITPVPQEFRNDPVAISECWAGSVTREEYMGHLQIAGFGPVKVLEESSPYEKGKIMVSSWTITGKKPV
jgi:SAM-dependent methyltransferase